ncbi:Do family serine endopeptidase [Acidisphaera rubrifaciens]|uniref:Endopeptidase DegP/Do n=1 Tax=Acidisphaera rubrifaciens HS-AP3 TaxID=1231350 RepID=A0A0D6P5H4_9PROT|nr:Do family serine endopeptidase [Acidisphaera rubrifaciens]GAN76912.1 endopeptidase DegP/Do [Acidisphaera rubrifaciens HS-AP3]
MPRYTLLRGRTARMTATAVLLAGTAIGGFAVGQVGYADPVVAPHAIAPAAPAQAVPDFANLVSRVSPAVVSITTELAATPAADNGDDDQGGQGGQQMPFPFMFRAPNGGMGGGMGGHRGVQHEEARGSGFLVDADGTIVTNNHVIEHAKSVTVTLEDGTVLPAKIIGRDPGTDLAVLRIKAGHKLPYLQLGDSNDVRVGQWVIAVGNPFGLSGTVTAGIVSARGRDIGDGPLNSNFIQVDAPINRGNSGGPLLTQDGKVVGVNSAIYSPTGGSVGIGFAIPSSTVRNVVAQLEEHGHVTRGYLGVEAQQISPALASAMHVQADRGPAHAGALVADVESDSPAAHAGLKSGDIIQSVNGRTIGNPGELVSAIAGMQPGATATIAVLRDGGTHTLDVTLGTRPSDLQNADATSGQSMHHEGTVGLALAPLTPDMREQLGVPDDTRGAVIAEVRSGSPAEQAGLQQNDVILGVGDHAVATPREARQAIEAARKGGNSVALRVLHQGHPLFVAIPGQSDNGAG